MKKLDLFSTPLLILPEDLSSAVCEPLRDQILARAAVEPGVQRSNAGGAWHSDHDLLSRPETSLLGSLLARHARHALQELAGRVGHTPPTLAGVQLHAWATVLPDRAWIMPHDHGDAHLSGVLHLDEGDGTHGNLCLLAPRASLLRHDLVETRTTQAAGLHTEGPASASRQRQPRPFPDATRLPR